jgi:hypothetical protein
MGKERLAEPGFYVEFYGKADADLDKKDAFGVIYISNVGKCKYIHFLDESGVPWYTLTWTCAPTKKKIERAKLAADDKEIERFLYFPTHADLCLFIISLAH